MSNMQIGTSSIWTEKYRPTRIADVILPKRFVDLFDKIISSEEIPNMIFAGGAGRGKTTIANCISNEIGCDKLFINASLDNSIDHIRYEVQGFATTSSLMGNKKLVILDESDRISSQGQDSLKGLIEQVHMNCRFIFTTNNLAKIISPLQSRAQLIDFSFTKEDLKDLIVQTFKRCCFILESEGIEYDKKILAEFVQKRYPDIRKIIGDLQKYSRMHGKIDLEIMRFNDNEGILGDLIQELKSKKFNNVRKIATSIDPSSFYRDFYEQIDDVLVDSCKPEIILILKDSAYQHGLTVDQEINMVGCLIQIMKSANWK